jgi:hypothetical protein
MARFPLIACAAVIALLVARPALAADAKQMEENKKTVAALYDAVLNQKDFDKASQYLGSRYTQHNPTAADGPEGLKGFVNFLKEKFPNNQAHLRRRRLCDRPRPCGAGTRHARQRHHRHLQARERQGGRALGRGAADPGEGREQQRDVLIRRLGRAPL